MTKEERDKLQVKLAGDLIQTLKDNGLETHEMATVFSLAMATMYAVSFTLGQTSATKEQYVEGVSAILNRLIDKALRNGTN